MEPGNHTQNRIQWFKPSNATLNLAMFVQHLYFFEQYTTCSKKFYRNSVICPAFEIRSPE